MRFLSFWAENEATVVGLKRKVRFADRTITDWKNFLRDVCREMVIFRSDSIIGGVGHIVQIDETLLSRRKYNRGRMYPPIWLFGGIDTQTKEIFLVPVITRNADTLIPIIQRHVIPGTTIVSDCWGAYNRLGELGYVHRTVNYSRNFVDPVTGAHTNSVECLWSKLKYRNKKECGTSRRLLHTYLAEYQWRRLYGNNAFRNIVDHIRRLYPLRYFFSKLLFKSFNGRQMRRCKQ